MDVTCEGGVYVHFNRLSKQAPLLSGNGVCWKNLILNTSISEWEECELNFRTNNSGGTLHRISENHQLLLQAPY